MIGLTLTLAALAAVAAGSGYIDGREYVYKYSGQVYSGFPRIKHQYSGYAFTSDVKIQPHGDYALVQVDHVKKAQFNEEIDHVAEHEYHYEDLPAHAEFLTRPFKVYREHGVVTKFEVTSDEPNFSVNLKRGLITLFNLKFEQDEAEDNDVQRPDPDAHYYTVNEDGVLGVCETAYVIQHEPYYKTPHNNIVLNVTKSRNYHKCSTSPNYVYGTFHGHECGGDDHEKAHTLHGNALYHYNIRGDRHHYIIERIDTEGELAYTPYPIEGQTVETHINRTLQLIEEHEVTEPIHISEDLHSYDSLSYNFEHKKDFKDPVDLKKPHYLYHAYGRKVPISDIRALFEELTHVYDDATYHEKAKDKNFPAKFLLLLRSVSTIGYEEINDLFEEFGAVPKDGATIQQKRYRTIFTDVLVNLGTNPALLFGKYLVEQRLFRPEESAYFIQQIPFHVKEVTEVLLEELQELCDNDAVKSSFKLHSTCVLALSNLVHDHCIAHLHPEGLPRDSASCPPNAAVKYFNYIARNYEDTENEKLKITYLKAAGNIGVKEAIPYIRPYVEGHGDKHLYYRDTALWALIHIAHRFPEKVRELLVPLLMNSTENYQLRLSAFNLLMQSKPKLHEIEALARTLKHEKDDQVRSYIYSTFKHLVNSTHPCDHKLAYDAHYALRILEEDHELFEKYDYTYSHHHYVGGFDNDYDYGGSTKFAYYASDSGYIPRTAYLGIEDFLGGKSMQTFGVGFKQFGLEKFLDKFIGPEGTLGRRSVFDLLKKVSKREASGVEKELNEIKQKLHLHTHEYEPIHGEIFFKYMGNHLSFHHFDDETFEDFFKEGGRFLTPDIAAYIKHIPEFYYQRFMLQVDKFYVIPTEAGLPLIMDYKQPFYFYHRNNEMGLDVQPGFYAEDRAGKYPDHVKGMFDGHLIVDKNLYATMSVVVPFDQVTFGAGINRRSTLSLPLKFGFDVNVKEWKVETKWIPVTPHDIYHFKYEPFTYVDSYANSVPLVMEEKYKPVRTAHRHDFEEEFFHHALGIGFDIKADYDNEYNDEGDWLNFLLEKDYREKFYYLFANPHFEPYNIDVAFTNKEEETTEVDTVIKYNFLKDPYTPGHFQESGGFEDYQRQDDKTLYTCSVHAEATAKGKRERKVQAEVAYSRDLTRHYHKLNVFYDRTAFTTEEHDHFKVCASGYLKYPHYELHKIAKLETLDVDHTVESEVKVHFGKDCNTEEKIKIQGRFAETEEQHEYELHREDPDTTEHWNPYAHYYHECEKERAHGLNYGENCMEYMNLATTVHKYSFHVKHEHLSPTFLNNTYKVGGFLRHLLYNYADHNVIDVHNPEDEIHLEGNFSIHAPIGDLRVIKPRSVSHYTHINVPHYHGFRTFPHFEDTQIKKSCSDNQCKIEGDHVITFDHYEYNLPPIDCYKVIARDCSPNEHFTVLGTKITHPKYLKAVKVFLGKHKIEALPVSEDSDIIIRIDGTRVAVTEEEPHLYFEDEAKEPVFYITKRDFYYALHSKKYGLIVEYDGRAIAIQVSPFYRAKMCGLCGNYNGQKYDGYGSKEGCHYNDDQEFAYAHAIPSDTCTVPEVKEHCEGEVGCTRLRTHVIQLTTGKVPQTCFSTEPVAECTEHCEASATVKRDLGYHCLPAKDDSTKALLRQQQVRVLHEVRRKSKDHEASVDVPDRCVKH